MTDEEEAVVQAARELCKADGAISGAKVGPSGKLWAALKTLDSPLPSDDDLRVMVEAAFVGGGHNCYRAVYAHALRLAADHMGRCHCSADSFAVCAAADEIRVMADEMEKR